MLRVVVLASGRGSNLQALIDAGASGALPIEIVAVLSDKPRCAALQRARDAGIPAVALDPRDYPQRSRFDRALFAEVDTFAPALIVLAGFMRILDPQLVAEYPGRMLNIHPSLLPLYPGLHTHQRALDAGDRRHGSSVHIVTPTLDAGPVVAQVRIGIEPGDTALTLAARLLPFEHRLLCACLALLASGRLVLAGTGWTLDGEPGRTPLQLDRHGALIEADATPA